MRLWEDGSEDLRLRVNDLNNCCDVKRNAPYGASLYLELPGKELRRVQLLRVHENFHELARQ